MPKAPRPTADAKMLGFREVFSSYFFMSQSNKNDQIVVTVCKHAMYLHASTAHHATIISDKFLKPNGIKNREVPYWQKLLWEENDVKAQVVLKVELKKARSNEIFKRHKNYCKSKKNQKVTLHDLDLKGRFE